MATGSARPVRNLRSGRYNRIRHESTDDVVVKLDHSKDAEENVLEILKNVVMQHGVPSSRKTAYLNSFVKLIKFVGYDKSLGVPIPDIMSCLEIGLLNEAKQVRAACLRVLRYLMPYEDTLDTFLLLHFEYLVARCLDVSLDNEIERIHAIKLIRQIIKTSPYKFPKALLYALVAIGNDGAAERDRMVRVSLETICELAFTNVDLVAKCGGIQTLIWNILDCHQYPRLNEALTSTIIFLLNHPKTRRYIRPQVDLERLLAPFTDSHFRYGFEDGRSEERDSKFIASKMAVITVMRSWPGLIRLCHPDGSGMQSLIGILYLPHVEIRRYILEVISDLFRLNLPTWAEDFATAFSSVDPSDMKDVWKLTEGFVAEEGRTILPHISQTRPNLVENHLALLLSAWFTAGLCEALIEVIITSEGALFNRAVLLLGELLHMANILLPVECMHHHECLPSLINIASSPEVHKDKRRQAYQAVMYLTRFHKMMKRGRKPCTLFLDQLLQHAGKMSEVTSKHWHLRREKLSEYYFKKVSSDDITTQAIRDSQVNTTKSHFEWNWPVLAALLRWPDEKLRKLDDQNHLKFIKRLVSYFKPENDLFSKTDHDPGRRKICIVGLHLIDFLLASTSDEAERMISELLVDIAENLKEVTKLNVPVDDNAMFGVKRLFEKMCRYYFLFFGRFSATKKGCTFLEKTGIIQTLLELMSPTTNILYVKLTISTLNYTIDGSTRPILSKALTATQDVCRLYATKFMRVLMRAGTPGFSHWGIELLVTQLYDPEKSVAMSALTILDEACDNEDNLKSLIRHRPSLLHLGERGVMLLSRFVSNVHGFRSLNDASFISNELDKWHKSFNEQYVDILEEMLNEALMTYEKTFTGSCPRRSILKGPKKDVFLPAHLYGQLTMHEEGLELLHKQECIQEYFNCIHNQILLSYSDLKKLKTALWVVGHIGLSVDGLSWLESENVIPEIIRLAEECGVFSIRGTAYFVLGLIACTRKGTDILCELGWEARCHTRKETFPVLDQDGWMHGHMEEALFMSDRLAATSTFEGSPFSGLSCGLSNIQEETFLRGANGSSKAAGHNTLRSSMSSVHSAREPLFRHSSITPHSYHNIPPYTSPPTLNVPSITHSQILSPESNNFRPYQSMPSRSRSEKTIPKKASEYRPRAQTGDKSSMAGPAPISSAKCESEPLHLDSVKLEIVDSHSTEEPCTDRKSTSRDSIQLVASPVVRLRNSSDEDSAILPDYCDSNTNDKNGPDKSADSVSSSDTVAQNQSKNDDAHSQDDGKDVAGGDASSKHSFSSQEHSSKNGDGDVVSFKIGGNSGSYMLGNKESSSSESSKCSKSRGSSFNTTDSTSGVGSCDSTANPTSTGATSSTITNSLTPIPSSASLTTLTPSANLLTGADQTKEPVHPSALQRSLFRLTRIPSAKRRSASPALGITANGGQTFTSQRDAMGYAALKNIKRQRTYSSDTEGESGTHLEAPNVLQRTISQDSEISVDSNVWLSMRRNVSSVSLQDQEIPSSPLSTLNRAAFKPLSPSNRFVGIALPVDVKMLFEVIEGEDQRTSVAPLSKAYPALEMKPGEIHITVSVPPLKKETSFEHSYDICLLCNRYRWKVIPKSGRKGSIASNDGKGGSRSEPDASVHATASSDLIRSRGGSMNDHPSSVTPGSHTSSSSTQDIAARKLTEDSEEGRELIRLEVMRLIVSLGSSVGLKGSETGLLSLKQRFPQCFQDICFYSEVCHLLSTYSYRLLARRFIQELFDELDITGLLENPCQFLGIDLDSTPHMAPIRQDSMDEFQDFSFS